MLSDISQAVVSFFVFTVLARKLNPEGYGTLNSLLAVAAIISVFVTNISANIVLTREFTLQPQTSLGIFRIVFPIRMFSFLLAIITLIFFELSKANNQIGYLLPVSAIVLSTIIWDLAESIAFGHFVTRLTTLISIGSSFVWLIVVIYLPSVNLNVNQVIWSYSCLFLLRSFVYLLLSYRKFVKINREDTSLNIRKLVIMSLPFLWMRIIGTFGDQVPILLLKSFSGAKEVAFYAVGNRFVMPITIAVTTGLRAVFPFMTKLYSENIESFKQKLVSVFTLIFILGGTLALILTVSSRFWLPQIFGQSYYPAIAAFNYQAWFGVLFSFDLLLSTVLSSTYQQKTLAIITTIDVLIIFPVMYFGSTFGAEGMAIAKLFGTLLLVGYHVVVVIRVLHIKLNSVSFMIAGVYFLCLMIISLLVQSTVSKLLFFFISIIIMLMIKNSGLRAFIVILRENIKQKI